MTRNWICTAVAAALLFLSQPLPVSAAEPAAAEPVAADPVVAKVDGQDILMSDIADAFARVPQEFQGMPLSALYSAVLDNLINIRLTAAAARQDKLDESPDIKEQMARIEAEILQRVYLSKTISDRLTDEMVQKRYDDMKQNMKGEEMVSARHILVDSEAQARDIIAELATNPDFAGMARRHSKGPSASKGGDLGYFTRATMVPAFADAAFNLKAGEITKAPIKTQFGWHVIKVEGRRHADPPSFEEMRAKLEDLIAQEIGGAVMDDLRNAAVIERFEIDPAALEAIINR